jgi:hypothetical protein
MGVWVGVGVGGYTLAVKNTIVYFCMELITYLIPRSFSQN